MIALFCCPRWTRTTAGRTKICSATITPWDNCECKSSAFLYSLQIFHELFSLSFFSSLFSFPFILFQKPYNILIFNYLQGCPFSFFTRFAPFKKYSFSFHFSTLLCQVEGCYFFSQHKNLRNISPFLL